MGVSPPEDPTHAYYLHYCSCIFGLVFLTVILIHHARQYYIDKQTKNSKLNFSLFPPSLLTSSFALLISGIIYCLSSLSEILWTNYISADKATCYVHFLLIVSMYSIFKLLLYICLCRRLVESFADAVTYSPIFLFYYQIFLTVGTIVLTIAYALFVETEVDFDRGTTPCAVTNIPDPLLISIVLFDFIACVVNLVLFIKPLWKLSEQLKDQSKHLRHRFTKLIKKNALLATVSTTTTFVVWIVGASTSGLWAFCQVMDMVTSAAAIVLLFKRNEKIFLAVCCCCCKVLNKKLYEEQALASRTIGSIDSGSKQESVNTNTDAKGCVSVTEHTPDMINTPDSNSAEKPTTQSALECISE
eukprot:455350_1